MNASRQHIALDLNNQGSMEYVNVRQGDRAKVVSASLAVDGTPYELAQDVTAVLAARGPDGTCLYTEADLEGGRLTAILPAAFTAAAGIVSACFRLTGDNDVKLTTPDFMICVSDAKAGHDPTSDIVTVGLVDYMILTA